MQARLCFAVAISVEPEILIIDEALAAGDSAFIAKCFERIRQICASGATVLFVSHNTYLVQRLCGRALWIDSGRLVADGEPALVCRDYEASQRQQERERREANARAERHRFSDDGEARGPAPPAAGRAHVWGTGELRFTAVELLDARGRPAHTVYAGDRLTIRLRYEGEAPYDDLAVVVQIVRADGVVACGLDAREAGLNPAGLHGPGTFEVTLDPVLLGRGRYFVSPHVYRDRDGVVAHDDVLVFHDRLYELDVERRGRPYDVAVEQPARWRHTVESPDGAAGVGGAPKAAEAAETGGAAAAAEANEATRAGP
jgi:lipopolysaccharide transport system ATP-binding protein